MENKNELAVQQQVTDVQPVNIFSSPANFDFGQRMAKVFATSTLVPAQYQNNIGNVLIALNMSTRMKADPLMVMQSLVIVHNTPTFEAKFAIACFNATGKYTPIRYEEIGEKGKDSYGMYAYAIDKATGDVLKGPEITIGLAKEEGWYARNPKWKSIPQLMLRYRAASWFIRTTDPGVMMGFQTKEEAEDVPYEEVLDNASTGSVIPQNEANKEAIDIDAVESQQNEENIVETSNASKGDKLPNNEKEMQEKRKKTAKNESKEQMAALQGEQPIGKQPMPDLFK